jgi:hypothetical protein
LGIKVNLDISDDRNSGAISGGAASSTHGGATLGQTIFSAGANVSIEAIANSGFEGAVLPRACWATRDAAGGCRRELGAGLPRQPPELFGAKIES